MQVLRLVTVTGTYGQRKPQSSPEGLRHSALESELHVRLAISSHCGEQQRSESKAEAIPNHGPLGFTRASSRGIRPAYNSFARAHLLSARLRILLVTIGRLTMLRVALVAAIAASASAFSPSSFLPAHGLRTRASSSATGVRMYVSHTLARYQRE